MDQFIFTRIAKVAQVVWSARLLKPLLVHRVLAGAEHRNVLSRDFVTVVDIGANRGQFSLATRKWAPNARIISFEPLPGPAAVFRKIFHRDKAVTLHEAGIGPEQGQCAIHVSARDDSSSLLALSKLQVEHFPGTAEVGTLSVYVAPLADFVEAAEIAAPAMLKLDVQGFELEVLKGCESLLSSFSCIYCECSFVELYRGQALATEIVEWVSSRGFRLAGVFNCVYDKRGRSLQADFLFER
jgi:FkbM family methyltransferase